MKKRIQKRSTNFFKRAALALTIGLTVLVQDQSKAQTVALIQDINTGTVSSFPTLFTSCGAINTIFFVAGDGTTGSELWKYDITAGTASLVKDIYPGSTGSGIIVMTPNLTNNGILFNANDGTHGNELWKSDGTTAGTSMVLDINTGTASSNPNNFYIDANKFIFSADNGTNGKEPWLTNGNAAGTALLKDINPGVNASDPNNFMSIGTALLFRANDGTNGSELWTTDMTPANTLLLKDINTGTLSSIPLNLTAVGGTLFFSATDPTNGAELWKSDGTLAGTQLVKDINPGTGNSINVTPGGKGFFTSFNNALYFQATDGAAGYELWKSDGTVAGTTLVKDIQAGASSSSPSGIFVSSTNLFFVANDGTTGFELWMSDGTTAGTALLKDINPGAASSTSITTTFLRTGNGSTYFAANDGTNGNELWSTLGTAPTTTLVADINSGAGSSSPASIIGNNNVLYFSANDGLTGVEPWKFDPNSGPTPTGIVKLMKESNSFDVYPNPGTEKVTIQSTETNLDVQLFSSVGQLIESKKISNDSDKTLNLTALKPGIYFVKVISEKGESVKKLIVN